MKLLLINKNPVVSRMLKLSAPKAGFEVEECDNVYNLPNGEVDVVFIDDEMYDENFLKEIRKNIKFSQIGLITSSKDEQFEEFDFTLTKPFLPTDLIELLRGLKSKIAYIKEHEEKKQEEISYEEKEETPTDILSLNEIPEIEDKKIEENLPEPLELEENIEREKIVEFEEEEEEEPFIPENELEESGVLDKNELEKVQELLEEEKPQEILTKEANLEQETQEEKEELEEQKEPAILEKLNNYKNEKESKPEPMSSEEKIKALMGALDLYTIRELLDGMEITIKINFNKKKKKKK
ncbi:hypothetical protein [Nitrosophilus kaiyonis]|uniref:hypothetical protein n=1 Tax=Nitrosophilus kaiyonis TaxID=2930200 RepID=UPI0024918D1A|nr:hypothetical protein [Nitrosophilus kaiyonis]